MNDLVNCKKCPLSSKLPYGCLPQKGEGKYNGLMAISLKMTEDAHLIEKPIDVKYKLLFDKLTNGFKYPIYFTNLLKCTPDSTNKKEIHGYIEKCRDWIDYEIEKVQPKAILTFGVQTIQEFTNNKKIKVETNPIEYKGIKLYRTFSLEEIYRKGIWYYNYTTDILDNIGIYFASLEENR